MKNFLKKLKNALLQAFSSLFLNTWLRSQDTEESPREDTKSSAFQIRKPQKPARRKRYVVKEHRERSDEDFLKKKMANGVDRCFTCGLFGGQPKYNCPNCGIKIKCEHCGIADVKMHVCIEKPKEEQ